MTREFKLAKVGEIFKARNVSFELSKIERIVKTEALETREPPDSGRNWSAQIVVVEVKLRESRKLP